MDVGDLKPNADLLFYSWHLHKRPAPEPKSIENSQTSRARNTGNIQSLDKKGPDQHGRLREHETHSKSKNGIRSTFLKATIQQAQLSAESHHKHSNTGGHLQQPKHTPVGMLTKLVSTDTLQCNDNPGLMSKSRINSPSTR